MDQARPGHYLLLLICLVGAFALRYPGIRFGLPLFLHPDEPQITRPAARIAATGQTEPDNFVYPSLPIYTQAAVYRLGYGLGVVRKSFEDFAEVPSLTLHFWGRLATVVFSLAVVWLVWRSGSTLAGPSAGIIAALLTAVALPQVQSSFSINAEILLSLWALAAYLAALRVLAGDADTAGYLCAGVLAGLAMGSKYIGVLALAPLVTAHLVRPGEGMRRFVDARLYLALAAAAVAFVATTPYLLRDGGALLEAIDHHRLAYGLHAVEAEAAPAGTLLPPPQAVTSYLAYSGILVQNLGAVALLLAGAGFLVMLLGAWPAAAVTAAFPFAVFAAVGAAPMYFERNMVCVVPFLAVFAGVGASRLLANAGEEGGGLTRRLRILTAGLAVGFALYTQVQADVAYTAEIRLRDTRAISKQWIEEHVRPGARIAREAYTPPLDESRFAVTTLGMGGLAALPSLEGYDYLVAASPNFEPLLAQPRRNPARAARYHEIFDSLPLAASFVADGTSSTGPSVYLYQVSSQRR